MLKMNAQAELWQAPFDPLTWPRLFDRRIVFHHYLRPRPNSSVRHAVRPDVPRDQARPGRRELLECDTCAFQNCFPGRVGIDAQSSAWDRGDLGRRWRDMLSSLRMGGTLGFRFLRSASTRRDGISLGPLCGTRSDRLFGPSRLPPRKRLTNQVFEIQERFGSGASTID